MSLRVSGAALTWSVGAMTGVCAAAFLGPFIPAWGMSVGVPVVSLCFALLIERDPRDPWCAGALRMIGAVTLGFLATTIPLTLREVELAPALWMSWLTTWAAVPVSWIALRRRLVKLGKVRATLTDV